MRLGVVAVLLAVFASPAMAQDPPATGPTPSPAVATPTPANAAAAKSAPAAKKAWLGIGIEHGIHGVRINEIIDRTPARGAGLVVGDEIIAVNNSSVLSPTALVNAIGPKPAGSTIGLTVMRRGRRVKVLTQLDLLPSESEIMKLRLVDRTAPDFRASYVDRSGTMRLASLRGRVVVLLFWASWNKSSRLMYLPLTKLANRYGHQGLVIIGVTSESSSALHTYMKKNSLPFTVVRDPIGHVRAQLYRAPSVPGLVVIDRSGVIRHAGLGTGQNIDLAAFAVKRSIRGMY